MLLSYDNKHPNTNSHDSESGVEVSTNPTIQSCWDADRLDLGRVGIIPSPKFLSAEASQLIDEAFNWSIGA